MALILKERIITEFLLIVIVPLPLCDKVTVIILPVMAYTQFKDYPSIVHIVVDVIMLNPVIALPIVMMTYTLA